MQATPLASAQTQILGFAWFPSISSSNLWQRLVPPISNVLPELPAERQRLPRGAVPRSSPHTRSTGRGIPGNPRGAPPPHATMARHQTARKRIPLLQHNSFLAPRCVAGRVPDAPQLLPRSKQSRFHRAHRNLENLRQLRVRLPLNFPQPQKRLLFRSQARECISNRRKTGRGFSEFARDLLASILRCTRMLSPPFRGPLTPGSEKIGAQRSPLGFKPIGVLPNLCKSLLHYVFGRLPATKDLSEKPLQLRRMCSVERVKRARISPANPLPKLAVVSQS